MTSQLPTLSSPLCFPEETAVLDARGKLCAGQEARALSPAVRKRSDLPAVRAAFAQFADSELVWLRHPEGKWMALARRAPAAVVRRARIDRREDYSMARHAAPFVRAGRPITHHRCLPTPAKRQAHE